MPQRPATVSILEELVGLMNAQLNHWAEDLWLKSTSKRGNNREDLGPEPPEHKQPPKSLRKDHEFRPK
jgi:hypothetical protein